MNSRHLDREGVRFVIAAAVAAGFITQDENTGDFDLTEKGVAFAA